MYVEIIIVKKLVCLYGILIMIGKFMKFNRDFVMVKVFLWKKFIGQCEFGGVFWVVQGKIVYKMYF